MIVDWLRAAPDYYGLGSDIEKALRFLRQPERMDKAPGWHETDGVRYLIQEMQTQMPDLPLWEAHRRHIDIQFILEGEETFGYTHRANLGARTRAYDAEDDIEFFEGTGEFVTLRPGMFAIQFPHDAHLPNCSVHAPSFLKRGVIKIECPPEDI